MLKIVLLLVCVVCLLVQLDEAEASAIRSSLMDNINSGLKMLGNNDRRLHNSHHSYYNRTSSGISDNVANLVSQSFAPAKNYIKRNNVRQDAIVIGDQTPSLSDTSFMGGMLKLLGFDSSKVGAVAVNGIIFIAQMVRYGASRFMDYMMTTTWDLYQIVDFLGDRMKNGTVNATATAILPVQTPVQSLRFYPMRTG